MSLHNLAHHVRAKGRGKDSMLVHMTPREVQGLQALAKAKGGTLTINPETGLPEAGFLDQILPVVAMAAATYFTAGAAAPALASTFGSYAGLVAGAGSGALYGGLGAGLRGGDVGKGALMGGLGGAIAGGMGAYDNVFSAASATPPVDPNLVGPPTPVDPNLVGPPTPGTVPQPNPADVNAKFGAFPEGPAPAPGTPGTPGGPPTPEFRQAFRPDVTPPPAPSPTPTPQNVVNPTSTYQGYGPIGRTLTASLPGIGGAMGEKPAGVPIIQEEPYGSQSTLSPDFQGYTPERPNPYYRAQYTRYAAGGGLMDAYQVGGPVERMTAMNTAINPQGGLYPQGMIDKTQYATPTQRPASLEMLDTEPTYQKSNPLVTSAGMNAGGSTSDKKKKRASLTAERTINSLDPYNAALAQLNNARYGANMSGVGALNPAMTSLGELPVVAGAKGGIADLGGYSDGGRMLRGPGDGMSDSIPATIGGKQPARLADGEFVVPADVVSHLGNGSTDAGAKKLYAMMDKVRRARTGKKKQAPAVNTGRFMPA